MGKSRVRNSKLDSTVLQRNHVNRTSSDNKNAGHKTNSSVKNPPDPPLVLNHIFMIFMFIFSLFIYFQTVYSSLPGGDSGELMVTAKEFGVAHPPGYPLFVMLSKLIIEAIPYGSTAFRVNVLSCVLGALTNSLVGAVLLKSTGNVAVSLMMAGMLGFSRLFWVWNITGEVFSLNNVLCTSIILVMYMFFEEREEQKKLQLAYVLAGLCGVAMSNQHTSILLILPTAIFVLIQLWELEAFTVRHILLLTITGLSGLIFYVQLPIASYLKLAKVSWGDHTTLHGILFHFFRKDFGTFKLVKNDSEVDVYRNFNIMISDLIRELTLPVMFLANTGFISMFWKGRSRIFIGYLLTTLLVYTSFFCTCANISDITGIYKGVLERFWMQPSLSIVILAGEGLNEMLKLARLTKPVFLPFAFLIVAARIHSNYEQCNRSESHHIENFGRHMLSHFPNDSILLTSGDLSTNTFRYLVIAEDTRSDIDVLDMSFIGSTWFIPILGHHMSRVVFPGIGYSPYAARIDRRLYDLEMFLDYNLHRRPVFVCLKPRAGTGQLKKYDLLPYSFCHQFVRKGAVDPLIYGKNIPTPDLSKYLPPRTEQFGDDTWEDVILHEFWEAKVKPGRFLWQTGEATKNVERKKQLYIAAYEYLYRTKENISYLISSGVLSPTSWNHTSYYSKYMGVQCRQLWIYASSKRDPKYDDCQRKHFKDYVESASEVTIKHDADFKNIVMLLKNPGM